MSQTDGTDLEVAVFAPALLLLVEVHHTSEGEPEVHLHAGGQGYWVARMVRALSARALPCVCVGGESGEALRSLLMADGLDPWMTSTSRPNAVHIEDRRDGGRNTIVTTDVPPLDRHEIDELYSSTIGASLRAGVCVLAGAQLAPILPADIYGRLAGDLRANDVTVVVDLSGDPLRAALEAGVDIVKISDEELVDDGWSSDTDLASVTAGIQRIRAAGADTVVVSRREHTTIAGRGGELYEVRSPDLAVVDGRGGGDSMTAALAVAAARGLTADQALRWAAAAGALNVSRHGLGSGRLDAIEAIAARVDVTVPPADPQARLDQSDDTRHLHRPIVG